MMTMQLLTHNYRLPAITAALRSATIADEVALGIEALLLPKLQAAAPHKTGQLAAETRVHVTLGAGKATVSFTSTPYAAFVVYGTGIYHKPTAHSGWTVYGLQAFEVNGQQIVTMRTVHKGQQPNDYPQRVWRQARPEVRALVAAAAQGFMV